MLEARRLGQRFEIRLREGADPARWLAEVAARVDIGRFEVRAPSLHSIFVDLVGGRDPAASPARAARARVTPTEEAS